MFVTEEAFVVFKYMNYAGYESQRASTHNAGWYAVQIESLRVVQCAQTYGFATYTMRCSEEMRWPLQRSVQLPLTSEVQHMETVLIVLVVLFLLGGGGWGYSRWRG